MNAVDPAYYGREQTKVKHAVLERYLTALALIVGQSFARDISFVDCCAGPWATKTDDLSDSSIGIAIQQLRIARDTLVSKGKTVTFRCLFTEKRASAYAQLEKFCGTVRDIEVQTLRGDFVQRIPEIKRFIDQQRGSFPFIFIDPTGWLPLKIKPLTPLLQTDPGEVLINFMTSFIARFLEAESKDFGELLGQQAMDRLRDLSGQDREDEAAFSYAEQIGRAGRFPFVCTTVVLNPQQKRTHYHLIYATRHHKGVQVFKDAERHASGLMAYVRADTQQRHRIDSTGQDELFPVEEHAGHDQYIAALRERYLRRAQELVKQTLSRHRLQPIPYDQVWGLACCLPLVWESDLHQWIRDWKKQSKLELRGMKSNQRVPKCQAGNTLVWTA